MSDDQPEVDEDYELTIVSVEGGAQLDRTASKRIFRIKYKLNLFDFLDILFFEMLYQTIIINLYFFSF